MPLNSINTNIGAMQALQVFNAINAEMAVVQRRISTGLKVSSVKDNPAIWAIAQNQRSEVRGLEAVKTSLARSRGIVDVSMAAAESISDLLIDMKAKALAATDYPIGDPAREALNDDYLALRRQIDRVVRNAEVNGINLLSAGGTDKIRALADTKAQSTIDVDHVDLSTTGSILSGLPPDLMGGFPATGMDDINVAMRGVNAAIGKLGTGAKALEIHERFVGKQQDALEAAIGNLVDADLAKESVRLQALQVQQQLALMALQIANRAPSILLELFRPLRR